MEEHTYLWHKDMVAMRGQGVHSLQQVMVMHGQLSCLTLPQRAAQSFSITSLCMGYQQGSIGISGGLQTRAMHHIQYSPGTLQVTERKK